jgi:hypothetical protein
VATLTRDTVTWNGHGRPPEARTWLRLVDVPDESPARDDESFLEVVFRYGQNDFQPRRAPSLSVGDLIVSRQVWRVASVGFEKVNELDELSPNERDAIERARLAGAVR